MDADRGEPALARGPTARGGALHEQVGAELAGELARGVAADAEGDRARGVRLAAARDDLADIEAALLGQALEARGELGDEPAGLGGADAGRDEEIVVGRCHSFTVMIGVRSATRVAWWWASSAAITGSIAL